MTAPRISNLRALASAAGAVLLVIAGLVIGVLNERAFRDRQLDSFLAQADVLAATVAPAVLFLDDQTASDLVMAMTADRRIEAAAVYNGQARRVAEFSRGDAGPPVRPDEGKSGQGGRLVVVAPVLHEGRQIGSVYLRSSPEALTTVLQRHGGTALLLVMAVVVLAGVQAMQSLLSRAAQDAQARAIELATVNDELQQQVRRRETAEDALQQSQKMETLGQLTGGIAHDFNNLLQTVQGSLDLISRRANEQERVKRWARMGLEAAERGSRLTAQLLAFSRSQKLEMRPVNVREVVSRMRDLLPATLGSRVKVGFELADGEFLVIADPTQLDLAILNLAINARDAMPNGGEIGVGTRAETVHDDVELPDGDYVLLSVADNGVGMPDDVRTRAFDPFYTTKGVGKGTGLGLAQVYGIAKQAGGVARIDSAAGCGTTVTLYLPKAAGTRPTGQVKRSASDDVEAKSARILIVDDDAGVRTYVCEILTMRGYECLQAEDGAAGLDFLAREPVDLLIVDYAMPGLSGAEVARAALAARPGLPIIFASGYADSAALEAALGQPAQLLRKPFDSQTLESRVATALAGEAG
jgi:signal transduction histidine kinase/CheY-like chemotaxis protein